MTVTLMASLSVLLRGKANYIDGSMVSFPSQHYLLRVISLIKTLR